MDWTPDTSGIRLTKPRHLLHVIDLNIYDAAIRWVSRALVRLGYEPKEAQLVPERECWCFYNALGEHIYTCPHALIEHIWDLLRAGGNDGA